MSRPPGFPGAPAILWRGATLRCARCGSGGLFRRYVALVPDCPGCGLHFEREEGYFAGALAVNIAIVLGAFAVVFVAILVATVPDVPVGPTLAATVPIVVVGPVVAYPFSKTLWMAIDYALLHRLG